MHLAAKLLVIALMAGALWWLVQPRYVFLVRVRHGVPRLTRGKLTGVFLQELGQACAESTVRRGWIAGVHRGWRVRLEFSRSIPAPCRQRLRNLWVLLA
jgi:hypothetical protein